MQQDQGIGFEVRQVGELGKSRPTPRRGGIGRPIPRRAVTVRARRELQIDAPDGNECHERVMA